MTVASVRTQGAGFVNAAGGAWFCLDFRPPEEVPVRGGVLFLPPWAEELNKSRRMIARGARAMAAQGWLVRVADPLGCGDSEGEFSDATWETWLAGYEQLADQLAATCGRVAWLWSLRGGALLVQGLVQHHPQCNLMLWQPAVNGRQMLTQFLRLKMAAGLATEGGDKIGTSRLREQLLVEDTAVEVAGYQLTPTLARGLDSAVFGLPAAFGGQVVWLDLVQGGAEVPGSPTALSPASEAQVQRLRGAGVSVRAQAVNGPAFWQTTEIMESDALLQATLQAMEAVPPAAITQSRAA